MKVMDQREIDKLELPDVESDLTMLGVTGVEDLLQEDVQKCIVDFKEAGCRVWILTGDKEATANQIGISCGVLAKDRPVQVVDSVKPDTYLCLKNKSEILISGNAITQLLQDCDTSGKI